MSLESELSRAVEHFEQLAKHGPDVRINAHKKAAHEAKEFSETPTLEEAADVLICVAVSNAYHGWTNKDLAEAIRKKMEINRNRKWLIQPDGTWQHEHGGNNGRQHGC